MTTEKKTLSLKNTLPAIGLVAAVPLVAWVSPPANQGFISPSAVLTMVTFAAVGIERVLEAFWSIVASWSTAWWPLNQIAGVVQKSVDQIPLEAEQFFKQANAALPGLAQKYGWAADKVTEIQARLAKEQADLTAKIAQLNTLTPDNQRVNLIAVSAFQSVSFANKLLGDAVPGILATQQAITGVVDFVATFKDNPKKRIISIFGGMGIGLVVAGFLGLDVFKAVAEGGALPNAVQAATATPWRWGVAFTGLLIGLGAGPTHDVIGLLQEIKKSRRAENAPSAISSVIQVAQVAQPHVRDISPSSATPATPATPTTPALPVATVPMIVQADSMSLPRR